MLTQLISRFKTCQMGIVKHKNRFLLRIRLAGNYPSLILYRLDQLTCQNIIISYLMLNATSALLIYHQTRLD